MDSWEGLGLELAESQPDTDDDNDARTRLYEFRTVLTEQQELGQTLIARAGEVSASSTRAADSERYAPDG
jgi:hypothetical protein